MRMPRHAAALFASLVFAITPHPGSADWREVMHDQLAPVGDRVAAALEGMAQDDCFAAGESTQDCAWSRFEVHPDHLDPGTSGKEAVLIVDVIPPAVEFLRYRNRILGAYTVSGEHEITPMAIAFDLPETFGEIVTGFASANPVNSELLAPLLPELNRLYGDHVPVVASHGTAVFNIFADLAPGQPLVLLDNNLLTFQQADPELFCSIPDNPGGLEDLRARAQRFADDFRSLVKKHNIRYVNASFGFTVETVAGPWQRVCGTALPTIEVQRAILETYRPVFEALFNTSGVFTAHAALASPIDQDAPFDQPDPDFPNRLRIGSLAHNGENIPDGGADQPGAGWSPVPADPADADIYVNAGCSVMGECREARPLSLSLLYGMGRADFPLAQSSFVTPLALARIIDLRQRPPFREHPFDDTLIDNLVHALLSDCDGLGDCRYFDPLLHGNAERFRNEFEPAHGLAGLWYDTERSGHGLELQRFGLAHAGLFYTFDDEGEPEWFWLEMARYGGGLYGDLLRFTNQGTPELLNAKARIAGHFSISFEPRDIPAHCPGTPGARAVFDWSTDKSSGQWCLRPLLVSESREAPNTNGMWWNGQQDSGWGFAHYANDSTGFRVVYHYDAEGEPTWAFGQAPAEAAHYDMFYPTGYCRSCESRPLEIRPGGTFVGALLSPMPPATHASLQLDHWQRIDFLPKRFSD